MKATREKVLIVGSEGFIGRNLTSGLLKKGYDIYGADLMDTYPNHYKYYKLGRLNPEFDYLLQQVSFDFCVNAAGSGSVPISIASPHRDFEANVNDTFRLLDSLRLYNRQCKYLHFSSAAVYGNPTFLPVTEEATLKPLSPYGYHKWISEIICKEFADLHNFKVIIVRPFSAYGPGLRKQLIWDLFQKIKAGERILLQGTGNETRDFIYIDDVVNAVDTIFRNSDFNADIYNLSSGVETSVKTVVDIFLSVLSSNCKVAFSQIEAKGNPTYWRADISKISSIGFQPRYNIEDGLYLTAQWLKQNG